MIIKALLNHQSCACMLAKCGQTYIYMTRSVTHLVVDQKEAIEKYKLKRKSSCASAVLGGLRDACCID